MNVLHPSDIEHINSTLPPQFAALKDKYPFAILNAADNWRKSPFPVGYVPHSIDVYYGDGDDGPQLSIEDGAITHLSLPSDDSAQATILQLEVDGRFAFIQIEGIVVLNLLEYGNLPDVLVNPVTFAETARLHIVS